MCPVLKTIHKSTSSKPPSSYETSPEPRLVGDQSSIISISTNDGRKKLHLAKKLSVESDSPAWVPEVMFALSDLTDDPRTGSEWFCMETIRILSNIPAAPAIRITIEGSTYESENFLESSYPEVAKIVVSGEDIGSLELHLPTVSTKDFNRRLQVLLPLIKFAARELSQIISSQRMTHAINTLCRHQLTVLDSISEAIYVVYPGDHTIIWSNEAFNHIWGHHVGQKCHDVVFDGRASCDQCLGDTTMSGTVTQIFEFEHQRSGFWFRNISKTVRWPDGRLVVCHVAIDITQRKDQEKDLRNANERLETNQKLMTEKNIALSQVLNQIEEEKRQIASQIQANVDRIIMPLVRKFDEKLKPAEREYLNMLRASLEDIASPFINEMQSKYSQLSPRELEVCNMIRNGQTSKDIAATFDTSLETVRKQRQNIRRKLQLTNSNTNLSSFLQNF